MLQQRSGKPDGVFGNVEIVVTDITVIGVVWGRELVVKEVDKKGGKFGGFDVICKSRG
jgi:hypothetical protein